MKIKWTYKTESKAGLLGRLFWYMPPAERYKLACELRAEVLDLMSENERLKAALALERHNLQSWMRQCNVIPADKKMQPQHPDDTATADGKPTKTPPPRD